MEVKEKVRIARLWLILMGVLTIASGILLSVFNNQLSALGKILWFICSLSMPFIIVKIIIPRAIKDKK